MHHAAMKRLECLDGLRGALAVYVLLSHMAPFGALPRWITQPLSHGGAAVDVFFVLSGLVIMQSLESFRFQPRPFLTARIARIFPVYLVMFALAVAVQPVPAAFGRMEWIEPDSLAFGIWADGWPHAWLAEITAHLTMTQGLFPNGTLPDVWVSFLGAAWSLSTEWQFYVLALLLGHAGLRAPGMAVAFLGLALAGLAWQAHVPQAWGFSRAFLPNKAQYFALGIASAVLTGRAGQLVGGMRWVGLLGGRGAAAVCGPHAGSGVAPTGFNREADRGRGAERARGAECGRVANVVRAAVAALPNHPDQTPHYNVVPVNLVPVGFYALILSIVLALSAWQGGTDKLLPPLVWTLCLVAELRPQLPAFGLLAGVLRAPLMVWFGVISYCLYLANEPIQKLIGFVLAWLAGGDATLFTFAWVPASLLLPVGAAAWLHCRIEAPVLRQGRALAHRQISP
jgi:peptidoglycan/LPS O-acetylase OafA/YrhL